MRTQITLLFLNLIAVFLFRPLPAYSQNSADLCRIYLAFLDGLEADDNTAKSLLSKVEIQMSELNLRQTFAAEFKGGQIEPLTHFGAIRKAMPSLLPRLLREAMSEKGLGLGETERKVVYLRNVFWGKEPTKPLAEAMHTLFSARIPNADNLYDLVNLRFAQKLGFRGTADFAAFVSTLSSEHFAAWLRLTLNGPEGGVGDGIYDLPPVARALGVKPFVKHSGLGGLILARVKGSIKPITLHPALNQIAKPPHRGGELPEALEWLREQGIVHSAIRTCLFGKGFRSTKSQAEALNDALRSERGIETLAQETLAQLHFASRKFNVDAANLTSWSTLTQLEREKLKLSLNEAEDDVVIEILTTLLQDSIQPANPLARRSLEWDFKTILSPTAIAALTAGAGSLLLHYFYPEMSTAASRWLSSGAAALTAGAFWRYITRPSSWFRAPRVDQDFLKRNEEAYEFLNRAFSLREILQRRLIETSSGDLVELDELNTQMLAAAESESEAEAETQVTGGDQRDDKTKQ